MIIKYLCDDNIGIMLRQIKHDSTERIGQLDKTDMLSQVTQVDRMAQDSATEADKPIIDPIASQQIPQQVSQQETRQTPRQVPQQLQSELIRTQDIDKDIIIVETDHEQKKFIF